MDNEIIKFLISEINKAGKLAEENKGDERSESFYNGMEYAYRKILDKLIGITV